MALRLADKLFTTTTLMHSTVNGTKEFAALDPSKIAAIKGIYSIFDGLTGGNWSVACFRFVTFFRFVRSSYHLRTWKRLW